eukprot:464631-Rhodomonas_salina.1
MAAKPEENATCRSSITTGGKCCTSCAADRPRRSSTQLQKLVHCSMCGSRCKKEVGVSMADQP